MGLGAREACLIGLHWYRGLGGLSSERALWILGEECLGCAKALWCVSDAGVFWAGGREEGQGQPRRAL